MLSWFHAMTPKQERFFDLFEAHAKTLCAPGRGRFASCWSAGKGRPPDGGDDAQKTTGLIAVLLFAHGQLRGEFHMPLWVVLTCQAAMGLGALAGGWRIVRTMGSKITRLTPEIGFCAGTGGVAR
jgi:hypothetical protein